jgi:hypothetical protein
LKDLIETRGDGWLVPIPRWDEFGPNFPASLEGLGEEERRDMEARATPQPAVTWTQPLVRGNLEQTRHVPKTLIASSFPLPAIQGLIQAGHPWFAELGTDEWSFVGLPTGHWPMFSRPTDLGALLLEVAESA